MQGVPQVTAGVFTIIRNLMIEFIQRADQYAAQWIYPFVQVERDTGTIYADDAENAMRYEDAALGRNKGATIVDIRLGGKTFSIHPRAFKTLVTESDKRNFQGPFAMEKFITRKLMAKWLINREVKAEALLRGSSNIQSQAATAAWNNSSLDPIKDIQAMNDKINKAIGNIMTDFLIPPSVWSARVMTNAASTFGKQMRDQLQYPTQMLGTKITPEFVASWLGVPRVHVPACVKAGGVESTTLQTGGLTGNQAGGFIYQDTATAYGWFRDDEPSVGGSGYGISPGTADVQPTGPHAEWDVGGGGEWYRVLSNLGEYELVPNAACKLTTV